MAIKKQIVDLGAVVGTVFTGINPKRYPTGAAREFRTINVKDLQQGAIAEINALQKTELPDTSQTDRFKVRTGDVLVAARGASKVAQVGAEHEGCIVGPNIIVIRPGPQLDGALLFAFLQHPDTQLTLAQKSVGTTVPTLTVKTVSEISLAIPSPEEQKILSRIVTLAENQMTTIRRAAESRRLLAQELVIRAMSQ